MGVLGMVIGITEEHSPVCSETTFTRLGQAAGWGELGAAVHGSFYYPVSPALLIPGTLTITLPSTPQYQVTPEHLTLNIMLRVYIETYIFRPRL